MTDFKTFTREPSVRVFAEEFRNTKIIKKFSDEEKAPSFALLPTGVAANRLFVVGVLTKKEKAGDQGAFYRGIVNDNTGNFFISASQYQPEAMLEMAKLKEPTFVALVGKPKVFERPSGGILASLRAESIIEVDKKTREEWIIDTAEATLARLKAIDDGKDPRVLEIRGMYGTDTKAYKEIVKRALESLFKQEV